MCIYLSISLFLYLIDRRVFYRMGYLLPPPLVWIGSLAPGAVFFFFFVYKLLWKRFRAGFWEPKAGSESVTPTHATWGARPSGHICATPGCMWLLCSKGVSLLGKKNPQKCSITNYVCVCIFIPQYLLIDFCSYFKLEKIDDSLILKIIPSV